MKHCGGEWVWWFGLVKKKANEWLKRCHRVPWNQTPRQENQEEGKTHLSVCCVQVHLCNHGIRHRPAERLLLETPGGSGHPSHHRRWWDTCTACSSSGKKGTTACTKAKGYTFASLPALQFIFPHAHTLPCTRIQLPLLLTAQRRGSGV